MLLLASWTANNESAHSLAKIFAMVIIARYVWVVGSLDSCGIADTYIVGRAMGATHCRFKHGLLSVRMRVLTQ